VQQQHQAIVAQTTQRLVAQAVQQAQQRMQQNGGGAPGSQVLQAAQAGAAASALMFPGMPQNGSNGVNMTVTPPLYMQRSVERVKKVVNGEALRI